MFNLMHDYSFLSAFETPNKQTHRARRVLIGGLKYKKQTIVRLEIQIQKKETMRLCGIIRDAQNYIFLMANIEAL